MDWEQGVPVGRMLERLDYRVERLEKEFGMLKLYGFRLVLLLGLWTMALLANIQPEAMGETAAAFTKHLLK